MMHTFPLQHTLLQLIKKKKKRCNQSVFVLYFTIKRLWKWFCCSRIAQTVAGSIKVRSNLMGISGTLRQSENLRHFLEVVQRDYSSLVFSLTYCCTACFQNSLFGDGHYIILSLLFTCHSLMLNVNWNGRFRTPSTQNKDGMGKCGLPTENPNGPNDTKVPMGPNGLAHIGPAGVRQGQSANCGLPTESP